MSVGVKKCPIPAKRLAIMLYLLCFCLGSGLHVCHPRSSPLFKSDSCRVQYYQRPSEICRRDANNFKLFFRFILSLVVYFKLCKIQHTRAILKAKPHFVVKRCLVPAAFSIHPCPVIPCHESRCETDKAIFFIASCGV